jgi:YbbR domain-containing protein
MWPFRSFGLKVVSVGFAVLLWLIVAGEEIVERGLRVPLELQQFPENLELKSDPPSLVDIRVRGTSSVLARLSTGDVVAVLDLRGARPGRRLFQLTAEQIRAPFGVEVMQVIPASVALVFENAATRTVKVLPSIDGSPAPGFVVGQISTDPESVEVVGPASSVQTAGEALTEPVSVAGARETVRERVTVGFDDPSLRMKVPRLATVTVEILPGPRERRMAAQPIHLRNLNAKLSARAVPATVNATLRGSRDSLEHVTPDAVDAFVDLAGLGAGDYVLPVHVETSLDAGVAVVEPATVQVTITSGKN